MLKSAKPRRLQERAPERIAGHLVGRVVGCRDGAPLVTYPGNRHGPQLARSTVTLPDRAPFVELAALLVFEQEDPARPIVVGLLEPQPAARLPITGRVDGKRVVLEAEDEIELRCGKASIVLRRNGRVVIRGAYVETCSEGVNRVRGGTVQIN